MYASSAAGGTITSQAARDLSVNQPRILNEDMGFRIIAVFTCGNTGGPQGKKHVPILKKGTRSAN
jgi:hypothetical protein